MFDKWRRILLISFISLFLVFSLRGVSYSAREVPFTLEDRDRLIRIETKLTEMDKRFEDMNRRFEELKTFLWILSGVFTALIVAVIGLALWDRRTMLREARREALEAIEKEGTLKRILEALRELAKEDQRLSEVLKKFNLL